MGSSAVLKVLFIISTHMALGNTGNTTGVWFEDLSTPYYVCIDNGVRVTIATLPGGAISVDPGSMNPNGKNPASVGRFLKDENAVAQLRNAKKLSDLSSDDYAMVYIPGGPGAMWDLAYSKELGEFLTNAWASGKTIASLGYGAAGLVKAKNDDGKPLVAGKQVSGFSNSENAAMNLTQAAPFKLESKLRKLGAEYRSGPDFQAFAVRDGKLVTGQNTASAEETARIALDAAGKNVK